METKDLNQLSNEEIVQLLSQEHIKEYVKCIIADVPEKEPEQDDKNKNIEKYHFTHEELIKTIIESSN